MIVYGLIFTLFISFIHALEELEIEGRTKHGWARNLPTKRFNNKITQFLVGKELTFYHVFMMLRIFLFYHFPFLFTHWTLKLECSVLALISLYFVFEDFLWFLLNPHFRLRNFNKHSISWHKRWVGCLPYTYISGLFIGIVLLYLGLR